MPKRRRRQGQAGSPVPASGEIAASAPTAAEPVFGELSGGTVYHTQERMSHTTTTPVRSDTCETLPHSRPGLASLRPPTRGRAASPPPPASSGDWRRRRRGSAAKRRGAARLAECAAQSAAFACGAAERGRAQGRGRRLVRAPRSPRERASPSTPCTTRHRGRAVASHAARTLHCELATALRRAGGASDVPRRRTDAFARCNADAEAQQLLDGAAAVVFVALGARGWVANAGDCRAVLHAGPGAVVAPPPWTTARPNGRSARVAAAGGIVEFDNDEGMLAVSRGLGDFDFARSGFSCEPHVAGPIDLGANDGSGGGGAPSEAGRFMLLASDGVFDVMSDDEACALVASSLADGTPPADACRALRQSLLGAREPRRQGGDRRAPGRGGRGRGGPVDVVRDLATVSHSGGRTAFLDPRRACRTHLEEGLGVDAARSRAQALQRVHRRVRVPLDREGRGRPLMFAGDAPPHRRRRLRRRLSARALGSVEEVRRSRRCARPTSPPTPIAAAAACGADAVTVGGATPSDRLQAAARASECAASGACGCGRRASPRVGATAPTPRRGERRRPTTRRAVSAFASCGGLLLPLTFPKAPSAASGARARRRRSRFRGWRPRLPIAPVGAPGQQPDDLRPLGAEPAGRGVVLIAAVDARGAKIARRAARRRLRGEAGAGALHARATRSPDDRGLLLLPSRLVDRRAQGLSDLQSPNFGAQPFEPNDIRRPDPTSRCGAVHERTSRASGLAAS